MKVGQVEIKFVFQYFDDYFTLKAHTMSFRKLEVYQLAKKLSVEIHKMTMQLPTFEMYETGRQVWRSAKSVRSNLIEGCGRRKYKDDFIRFVIYSLASNDKTIDHIETLWECGSIKDEELYFNLVSSDKKLGIELNHFLNVIKIPIITFLLSGSKKRKDI